MNKSQVVADRPAATRQNSARLRIAGARRLYPVTFLVAALAGSTAAQASQDNSRPTTEALELVAFRLPPEAAPAEVIGVPTLLDHPASRRAVTSPVNLASQQSGFDGTYTLDEADSDNIAEAIEDAARKWNFLTRHFARSRLKALNPAYRRVTIVFSPNEISVKVDDQLPLRAPADGKPVAWVGPDGGKVNASMQLVGRHLVQTFNSADGRRTNDYNLSPDGRTLTMQVTETSSRLSQAISYKQVYRRVS